MYIENKYFKAKINKVIQNVDSTTFQITVKNKQGEMVEMSIPQIQYGRYVYKDPSLSQGFAPCETKELEFTTSKIKEDDDIVCDILIFSWISDFRKYSSIPLKLNKI